MWDRRSNSSLRIGRYRVMGRAWKTERRTVEDPWDLQLGGKHCVFIHTVHKLVPVLYFSE